MKKSLLLLLAILGSSIGANTIEIKNLSGRHLEGSLLLTGFSCNIKGGSGQRSQPLGILAHSTKKITTPDCCAQMIILSRRGVRSSEGTWDTGFGALAVCGKVEKFEVHIDDSGQVIIKNVTGKK